MPKKWLGRKVLNEIEVMRTTKPTQYKHMYLGMITGTGREYFRNVTIRPITDEEIANFDYFNMGIDWGYKDPNVFLKTYIHDGKMYIFDEIYQDELPSNGENKYVAFAKLVKQHTKDCPHDPIYCDAQDTGGKSIFEMPQFNIPVVSAPKHGANGRDEGYSFLQGLDEIIIDPVRCPHSAVDFPMFESAVAPGGDGTLDSPGKKNDHCTDCARYSEWENIQNNSRNDDSYETVDLNFLNEDSDDFDDDDFQDDIDTDLDSFDDDDV